jgi:hypothetical protein
VLVAANVEVAGVEAAESSGDVRGVVTGDTDDLPGRRRVLSGSKRAATLRNAEMSWGMPEPREARGMSRYLQL